MEPRTPPEIGGMGHSVKRKEDPRFIRGQGTYVDDVVLPDMLYLDIVLFNLTITLWIGERHLALVGAMLYAPVVVLFFSHVLNPMRRANVADVARHRRDFPESAAVVGSARMPPATVGATEGS